MIQARTDFDVAPSVGTPRIMGSAPVSMIATPLVLNTHPDVYVEETRSAGVNNGILWNQWLKCPWTVSASIGTSAYRWTATFHALDDGTRHDFAGIAGTRDTAKAKALHVLTQKIQDCVEHRKRWMIRYNAAQLQSLAAGVPVAG